MSIFKCKMCGGDLEVAPNQTVCECDYCGSKQTLPKMDDDSKANLYRRANHFRRNNDFDKAMAVYERILSEDETDAEAYWSLVLCRFGIEYVEDPATHKRVPTVNRAQYTSIFDDDNYKQAIAHADIAQKLVYEEEAKAINEIQKGILAISQKEEPFDVFICYKETDTDGRRTQDSVLANDLYHQLKQEGFKVFFSRITLEDKLGVAYEPYIFAALNSARVMVVLGTKPEYFNAVWVKNEWSRYLAIVKQSAGKKVLIPAYRDMDPYDLPEEFSHLQAQDMSKLGFMQDLIRGIKKILAAGAPKAKAQPEAHQPAAAAASADVAPLYKRATLFLEDGDFASATEYADRILDSDPEFAPAYMVKVLAAYKAHNETELEDKRADASLPNNPDMKKAIRFAKDGSTYERIAGRVSGAADFGSAMQLLGIIVNPLAGVEAGSAAAERALKERLDKEGTDDAKAEAYSAAAQLLRRLEKAKHYPHAAECASLCDKLAEIMPKYDRYMELTNALQIVKGTNNWQKHKGIASGLAELDGFRDSRELSKQVSRTTEDIVRKLYNEGVEKIKDAKVQATADDGWRMIKPLESEILIDEAKALYEEKTAQIEADRLAAERERKEKEAAERAANRLKAIIAAAAAAVAILIIVLYTAVIKPASEYNAAKALYNDGKYEEAIMAFEAMNGYSDSATQIEFCRTAIKERDYNAAKALYNDGKYEEAITAFEEMNGYSDSATQIEVCRTAIKERDYNAAKALLDAGKYSEALTAFTALKGYKDVDKLLAEDENLKAAAAAAAAREPFTKKGNVVTYGHYEQDNNTSNGKEAIEWIVLDYDASKDRALLISKYGLDAKAYHNKTPYPTWEKSDIRAWLNGTFLNSAFTAEEQKGIVKVRISTPDYSGYDGGNDTDDRIWLLSRDEATKYFTSDSARQATPTKYAVANGAWQSSSYKLDGVGCCVWWLRSPGYYSFNASYVTDDGSLDFNSYVYGTIGVVRPAFWLHLGSASIY